MMGWDRSCDTVKGERCRQRFLLFPPSSKASSYIWASAHCQARQVRSISAPISATQPPVLPRCKPTPLYSTSILLQSLFCRSVCTVCFTDLWLQSCPKYLAWVVPSVPERLIPPLPSPATETPENLSGVIWLQTPGWNILRTTSDRAKLIAGVPRNHPLFRIMSSEGIR